MNRFIYKAVDDNGNYINGKLSAETPGELLTMLRSTRLELISYKIESTRRTSFLPETVKTRDLILMFVHLEQLDRAGVPILESLAELKDSSESSKVRNLAHEIHDSVQNGSLFSESLAKHPHIFNSVYVGLVAAGEKTGHLAAIFANIVEDLKWSAELKRRTRKAIMGPIFGIFVMFAVMGVMMGIVVPKVTSFLVMQNIPLPTATKALIGFSNFVLNYWLLLIFFIPLFLIIISTIKRFSPEFGVFVDSVKLKIPVFGPILTKLDVAKFCQFFSMTFKSGIGVIECLEAGNMVVSNKAIKRSIGAVKQQVSDGQSVAKAIAQTGLFPPLVSRMFKVGEDSGNMDQALQNIKFFYDREINDSIERLVGLIQPTLTFVMGGMIAWVTIAVFGPIYGTFSQLK